MDYKYIYPLYEEEEVEEASDFITDTIIQKFGSGTIKTLEKDFNGDMKAINLEELPETILKDMLRNLVFNAYGVNAPLMANYFKVEDVYLNRFETHIVKYLDLKGFKAESISFDKKGIVLKKLGELFMEPGFKPISRWNPKEKWVSMEYTNDMETNLMNPINQCFSTILSIESKCPNKYVIADKFVDMLGMMCYKYSITQKQESTDKIFGLRINILPTSTYQSIIKLAQLIHKYF